MGEIRRISVTYHSGLDLNQKIRKYASGVKKFNRRSYQHFSVKQTKPGTMFKPKFRGSDKSKNML